MTEKQEDRSPENMRQRSEVKERLEPPEAGEEKGRFFLRAFGKHNPADTLFQSAGV